MGFTAQESWSGSGFPPFSSPDLPLTEQQAARGLFVTEWSIGGTPDEQRRCPRRPAHYEVVLTDPDWWETDNQFPIKGKCLNHSDEGIYAIVPLGYGLTVGQRYLFHWSVEGDGDECVNQLGIIVRSELLPGDHEDQLGIGVRLSDAEN